MNSTCRGRAHGRTETFGTSSIQQHFAQRPADRDNCPSLSGCMAAKNQMWVLERPWSQYFCCVTNREYIRKYPIATKRVLRAIVKAADLCATEPVRVARQIVDAGFTPSYDYALQTIKEIPYVRWREYDPADAVRFCALRLREAGMIRSNPNKILADGTVWRHWNELKRELKNW
jgi:hypothetical protein